MPPREEAVLSGLLAPCAKGSRLVSRVTIEHLQWHQERGAENHNNDGTKEIVNVAEAPKDSARKLHWERNGKNPNMGKNGKNGKSIFFNETLPK